MGRFDNMTIKSKLIIFTLGITSVAIFIGLTVALFNDVVIYKQKMKDQNVTVARLSAENCVYSLEFGNGHEALETLAQLGNIDGFEAAALYSRTGALFVTYPEGATVPDQPGEAWKFTDQYSSKGRFEGFEDVTFNQEKLGTIYLRLSTHLLTEAIRVHLLTMFLIFGGTMLLAGLLVVRFQYLISEPIVHLASVTKQITEEADYGIRVGKTTGKEMIQLYNGFNAMLTQIQKERRKLAEFNESLEALVKERTWQLQESMTSLETTNVQLEEANRHKTRFLSAMSHELRTPLNAILGFSDLLAGQHFGLINEKQTKYVRQIESSGKHLLELINDLLDVAKIDAGAMELSLETFSLARCAEETLSMLSTQVNKKNIQIQVIKEENMTPLFADKRKIRQIFLNLFSNAVKYTPDENGSIVVTITMPGSYFRCSIKDNGLGIDDSDQHKIFSEFYQANRRRDEVLGGTGIGLALTRRLVEIHGGEIGVASSPQQGSEFWFSLPLKEQESIRQISVEPEEVIPDNLRGARILVAEDNEVNRAMIVDMLGIRDHVVFVATNGQEALALAKKHQPQLIFMDIRMPLMDGLEATRHLRNIPRFALTPIVALTASVEPFTKRMCKEAGCTAHLAKPVQSHELFEMIETQLGSDLGNN